MTQKLGLRCADGGSGGLGGGFQKKGVLETWDQVRKDSSSVTVRTSSPGPKFSVPVPNQSSTGNTFPGPRQQRRVDRGDG